MIAADPDLREAIQTAADALSQALELLPAVVRPTLRTVLVNVKVDETLVIALAERAQAEGITQKQASMRALAAAGVMALQLGALRDALIDAGAKPDKADKAAEEVAEFETRFSTIDGRLGAIDGRLSGIDARLTLLSRVIALHAGFTLTLLGSVFAMCSKLGDINGQLAALAKAAVFGRSHAPVPEQPH